MPVCATPRPYHHMHVEEVLFGNEKPAKPNRVELVPCNVKVAQIMLLFYFTPKLVAVFYGTIVFCSVCKPAKR